MSKLLTDLVGEHDRILAVVSALREFADGHAQAEHDARTSLGEFVRFFREYLDGWHHRKEESLLFDVMARAGVSRESGPIACMRHDHELGRRYIVAMATMAASPERPTGVDLVLLQQLAAGFSGVVVPHIVKENRMLYPMAERLLPKELLTALEEVAEDFDRRGAAIGGELERLGERLVARYEKRQASALPALG
jgi:hemerythrin-like domain-containing protein